MSQKKIKRNDKKHSQDLDPDHDQFINKTAGFLDWAYAHRRPILLLIGLALVVSVAGIFINQMLEDQSTDASALLGEGLEASTALVTPPDPEADPADIPEKSEEDEELLTFDSSKARGTEMLNRWKKVVSDADDKLKVIGELGVATSHFELGEYDKAIASFEKFLNDRNPKLAWLRPSAVEGLGYALEAAGKVDEARKKFEELMGESQGEAKRVATYQAGRMAQLKGDAEGAKKLFKQVLDSYSEEDRPSRFDLVFVQSRARLLELDPAAKVPDMPSSGMNGWDPRLIQQLMQAQQGAGAS